jgi:hypothetical protein
VGYKRCAITHQGLLANGGVQTTLLRLTLGLRPKSTSEAITAISHQKKVFDCLSISPM